jgi:hypothetical protein
VSLLELQILHCSPTTLFFGYHVNDASSLANLIPDIVLSVANKIDDARDFIMFKAVCKDWNCARSGEACQFDPWILKSEFIGESGVGTFASVADMRLFEVSFHWLGKAPD